MRPGGENGGAKPLALALIESLAELRPGTAFLLLTSRAAHEDLAHLDRHNVSRICVAGEALTPRRKRALHRFGKRVAPRLPQSLRAKLNAVWKAAVRDVPQLKSFAPELPDLIFCPFTATIFRGERIPVVCLVHDVQFTTYPQFFGERELAEREDAFRWACARANRIICPSNYVKNRVLGLQNAQKTGVNVVKNAAHTRFCVMPRGSRTDLLDALGLADESYFLYPANFWPHKNHEMLVTAFAILLHRRPDLDARLVLTGAPGKQQPPVREFVRAAGIADRIHMPGFVSEEALTALMQGCLALVFPSLYEGFGMPVVEAMSMGRPVLCANTTALPEVAGDAALLFDPRAPFEIADAMERIMKDPALVRELSAKGKARAASFGDSVSMAREYLLVFDEVVAEGRSARGKS